MIQELPITTLAQYADLLRGPHLALVCASIEAGNTTGRLWTIGDEREPAVLLWDKGNNVLYLSHLPAAHQQLALLIDDTIRPQALAEGARRFKIRALAPAADDILAALVPSVTLTPYPTDLYCFATATPPSVPAPSVDHIRFVAIDQRLLADESIETDDIMDEIRWMWPSVERFYEQGIGYAALVGDEIICWCTAEYLGATSCGVGIATMPAYAGRGVATATAAQFVGRALERGLTPYWECHSSNRASSRVAEKVGFTLVEAELFWVGMFAP